MIDISVFGHVFFVQFVSALFIVSTLAYTFSFFADKFSVKYQARLLGRWSLWISVAVILVAITFGLFAYSSSNHDDMSHALLIDHRNMALIFSVAAIMLSIRLMVLAKKDEDESVVFLFIQFVLSLILLYVIWMGILLGHNFGVGVKYFPDAQSRDHLLFDLRENHEEQSQTDLLFISQ